ncbi:DNA primase [Capillibacterium thermochitinicola]|uniref:DNA primase n=1 Tax=Capillibacterium thermochitinicola TaxID=2699427 RepID=A0A8J6LLQ8_9FIRM|nr:DNA primase [Capillibacterium thermochitinicola]MBA2132378.1 DNA primase [Capillibacterium thermochitinicola]
MDRLTNEKIISDVKENNDIVAVVSEYVNLKQSGRSFTGLCPFHSEKTPSFTVSREKQLFYCFGCGAGGDVLSFIMRIENLSFGAALRFLAERANMRLPEFEPSPTGQKQKEERERLYRLNAFAAEFYKKILWQTKTGEKAVAYLEARGITRATAEKFGLGYAPPQWRALVGLFRKKGVPLDEAEKAGLVCGGAEGYYDRFRDRLLFPITDPRGRVIGFGGRILGEGQPKYLNSPETVLYQKSRSLYGLAEAREGIRRQGRVIIVEGYMDVIQAHQHGIDEVVASSGTALTPEQVRLLKRYSDKVFIAYDADAAGEAATIRGLDLLAAAGAEVRVVRLPAGEDPDSLLKKEGAAGFRRYVAESVDLFTFKLAYILEKADLATPTGKAQAVQRVFPLLTQMQNEIAREAYLKQTAAAVGVSEASIYDQWRIYKYNLRKNKQRLDIKNNQRHTNDIAPARRRQPDALAGEKELLPLERELLRGCLQEKDFFARIRRTLIEIKFSAPLYDRLRQQLVEWDLSGEWPPPADAFPPEIRGLYMELLAENQMNPLPVDLDGCLKRLRQRQLTEEIRRLEQEVAVSLDGQVEGVSPLKLQENLALLNELHKKLREEFPTFSGLI